MAKRMGLNGNGTADMIRRTLQKDESITNEGKKKNIPIDLIDPNPDNKMIYRIENIDSLKASILSVGYLQSEAIGVFAKDDGRYEIYSGERRYTACKELGMTEIPAIVSLMPDEATKARMLISCNTNGREVTIIQTAKAMEYYQKKVLDQTTDWKEDSEVGANKRKYIAKIFGVSEVTVHRYLKLLQLIPGLQELVDKGVLPYRTVYKLADIFNKEQQEMYLQLCNNFLENYSEKVIPDIRVEQFLEKIEKESKEKKEKTTPSEVESEKPESKPVEDEEKGGEVFSPFMNEPQTFGVEDENIKEKDAEAAGEDDELPPFMESSQGLEEIILEREEPLVEDETAIEFQEELEGGNDEEYMDEVLAKALDHLRGIVNGDNFSIKNKRYVKGKLRGINEVIRRIWIKCAE